MAYTIEEVFQNSQPADNQSVPVIVTTVIITQEDGNTAWARPLLEIRHQTKALVFSRFPLLFSDRDRFRGEDDPIGIKITIIPHLDISNPSLINVEFTLIKWSVTYIVSAGLQDDWQANGKIYLGYGSTIGRGSGKGLHAISFNELRREPIRLL